MCKLSVQFKELFISHSSHLTNTYLLNEPLVAIGNQINIIIDFQFFIILRRCVLGTTLCDKVCQWLPTGRWFSLGIQVSSTNKTDPHDITEILLKVALILLFIIKWSQFQCLIGMQLDCYTVALISDSFFTFWFIFSETTGLIHSQFYTEL